MGRNEALQRNKGDSSTIKGGGGRKDERGGERREKWL